MGAWAFEKFGGIPSVGDSFRYYGLDIRVTEMDHNRIKRLEVTVANENKDGGEEQ